MVGMARTNPSLLVMLFLAYGRSADALHLRQLPFCQAPGLECEESRVLVGSRGLLKSCDVHPLHPVPDDSQVHPDWDYPDAHERVNASLSVMTVDVQSYLKGIVSAPRNPSVYVITSALPDFAERVLPHITKPFVLVTGSSVKSPGMSRSGSSHSSPERERLFHSLIDNPLILRWFAQNALDDHPKLERMPLGVDYHTLAERSKIAWGPQETPKVQEEHLFEVRAGALPLAQRPKQVFVGGISANSESRYKVLDGMKRNKAGVLASLPEHKVERLTYWKEMARYQFTASPASAGVDCHRTWEILALGGVPLLSNSSHNALFKDNGLPFVEVKDDEWGSLDVVLSQDPINLGNTSVLGEPHPALTLQYWVAKIRAAAS